HFGFICLHSCRLLLFLCFLTATAPPQTYTLSLHDALPIFMMVVLLILGMVLDPVGIMLVTLPVFLPLVTMHGFDPIWFGILFVRSEEHTSELQSRENLVCRLLLEKKKKEITYKHQLNRIRY